MVKISVHSQTDYANVAQSLTLRNILPTVYETGNVVPVETKFNLILVNTGTKKPLISKTIHELTKFGPKEVNDLMRNTPSTILEGVSREKADDIKAHFEKLGAEMRIETS